MKTIAVHSHKGGVGKTTVSLLLAKYAHLRSNKVCVVDLDFIGSGMSELLPLEGSPKKYLEEFFIKSNPGDMDLDDLLVSYSDIDIQPDHFSLILNLGVKYGKSNDPEKIMTLKSDMMGLVRNEKHFGEIREGVKILLKKLEMAGFTLAILDCHPGLSFVSEAIRPLANLNVYVTTPNRSDCFSLLKVMNMQKLDNPNALLVYNRAETPIVDFESFKHCLENDELVGLYAKTLFPQLRNLGDSKDHFLLIPHNNDFKTIFHIGKKGYLPAIDDKRIEFIVYKMILSHITK